MNPKIHKNWGTSQLQKKIAGPYKTKQCTYRNLNAMVFNLLLSIIWENQDLCYFLGATKHLYNWLCPSVGWLVGL